MRYSKREPIIRTRTAIDAKYSAIYRSVTKLNQKDGRSGTKGMAPSHPGAFDYTYCDTSSSSTSGKVRPAALTAAGNSE